MHNIRFILIQAVFSKYGFITTLLIVIQQILSASSVIFLTKAINLIDNPNKVLENIILFFILIISPYIPVCIAQVTMYKVVNDTHHKIVSSNMDKLRYKTFLLKDDTKSNFISNLSRNSFMIMNDYFIYIYRVFSLILNILLTIIIISNLISIEYLYSFIFSLIMSFIFLRYITTKIEKSSILVENKLSTYATAIKNSWSNLILVSNRNVLNYKNDLFIKAKEYYDSKLNNSILQQLSNFISALIALIPLAIVSVFLIYTNIGLSSVLSAILVNLTRMVGLFSFLGNLIYDITNFMNIKSRIQNMINSFNVEESEKTEFNFKVKPIYINNEAIENINDFFVFLKNVENGRFTVTGENGSGKTTLLHYLLKKLKDSSIFIPTTPNDLNWDFPIDKLSTGWQVFKVISDQIANCNEKIILIDEWDANLDMKNTIIIDQLLDDISMSKVIVEIRHL